MAVPSSASRRRVRKPRGRCRSYLCILSVILAIAYLYSEKIFMEDEKSSKNQKSLPLQKESNLRGGESYNPASNSNVIKGPSQPQNILDQQKEKDDEVTAEQELDKTIYNVMADVEGAEEEEIKKVSQSLLDSALQKVGDSVKFALGRIFGTEDSNDDGSTEKVNEEEMEEIAAEVEQRLKTQITKELRDKADAIVDEKAEEIEQVVVEDDADGLKAKLIERDVIEVEKKVVEDLKDEIDEAAEKMKGTLKKKAAQIEADVIEEHTGKHVTVVEDGDGTGGGGAIKLKMEKEVEAGADEDADDEDADEDEDADDEDEDEEDDGNEDEVVETGPVVPQKKKATTTKKKTATTAEKKTGKTTTTKNAEMKKNEEKTTKGKDADAKKKVSTRKVVDKKNDNEKTERI